jgi:predicted nucleotidyltransferase
VGYPAASRAALLSQELDRFIRIVSTEMDPERIIVFGSMASGEIGEWSDLDVVVVMETELPFLERLRLILRRVWPKVALDLFVYTPAEWAEIKRTRPFVRDEIDAKGTVVYEQPSAAVG